MNRYSILVDMYFNSEKTMEEMEQDLYENLQSVFSNYKNITVKINRDYDENLPDRQRNLSETSIKIVNCEENKYDF